MAKARGRPFAPGNTAGRGRPPGSRNKATQISEALFAEYAEPITKRCIADAMKGDPVAQRLALDRVCPVQRERTVKFPLPPIEQLSDLPAAAQVVTQAVSAGDLTPGEGQKSMAMLEQHCNILLKAEVEPQLRALENSLATDPQGLNASGVKERG